MDTQNKIKSAEMNWGNEEDKLLIHQYTIDKLWFLELCEKNKRSPSSISNRLKHLNLIDSNKSIRGYSEYLKSDLFTKNTIVSNEWSIVTSDSNTNIKSQFPSRIGKPWKEEEIIQLLKLIQENKSISEISEIHQRTEGGVISKLQGLAANFYISDKKTIEEIKKCTGLSEEVIQEAIQRKQYKDSLPKKEKNIIIPSNPQETSLNELLIVIKDIQHKMNIIFEKIK